MVDSAFLLGVNEAVTPTKGAPPIFHVTPDAFTPTLLDSELERIDNVCTQGRQKRAGPAAVEAARLRVLGTKEDRPDVGEAWMNKNPRECANCHAVKDKALMICSRCVLYEICVRLVVLTPRRLVGASWHNTAVRSGKEWSSRF